MAALAQKNEPVSTMPNLAVPVPSRKRPERLLLNLTDEESDEPPEKSPLPSPLKLYADWTKTVAADNTSSDVEANISEGERESMRPSTTENCDYDSLPPALRRKYFSSLERLRLAQQANKPDAFQKHGALTGTYSVSISAGQPRPAKERRSSSYLSGRSTSKRLQKQESKQSNYLAAQADTQFYMSLPKKIQRKHFTQEEQVSLANNRDTIILDAADEKLYRLGQKSNNSSPSMHSSAQSQGGQSSKSQSDIVAETKVEPVVAPAADVKSTFVDDFRWLGGESDIDLRLDDYHTHIAQTADPPPNAHSAVKRRPSFRRFSLTAGSFGRSSGSIPKTSAGSWSRRPSVSVPSSAHNRAQSITKSTLSAIRRTSSQSASPIDPLAKHYRDPEARLKLRVYLASPQKFDEAVEFGFPSLRKEAQEVGRPPRPSLVNAGDACGVPPRRFLDDDNKSLLNDEVPDAEHDVASLSESDTPKTPEDFPKHAPPTFKDQQASIDSITSNLQPRKVVSRSGPYVQTSTGNREMTLHMTLTRPDLRTNEDRKKLPDMDALKLAGLPPAKDGPAIWDSLPADGGKVKKMWKRLARR